METEHSSSLISAQQNGSQKNGAHLQSLPLLYTAQPYESDDDEVELGQIFAIVRRRAVLISGVALAVASAALLWALTRTPKYEGRFQLLVEPVVAQSKLSRLPSIAAEAASLLGTRDLSQSAGLDYETQIEVLKSPKLMLPIIRQLQSRYPGIDYKSLIEDEKLEITRREETKILEISYQDPDPQKVEFVLNQVAKSYLNYGLQERQTNTGQGIKFVDQQLPRVRQRVNTLQGQLQQFQERYNLVDPEVQGEQLATRANSLEEQQLKARTELGEANSLYKTLQSQLGLRPNEAVVAATLSEAPRYQKFLEDLQEVEAKIAEESAQFRDDSPIIQDLESQRQNLVSFLNQEAQRVVGSNLSGKTPASQALSAQLPGNSLRLKLTEDFVEAANQIQVLRTRDQAIAQAGNSLNQRVQQLPFIVRQYTDLQRELKVASGTLEQLLLKRETLGVEAAQQDVPWEIIADPKLPRDQSGKAVPMAPKLLLYLGLGGILGVVLGLAAALIAEQLNKVFHTPEDVKDATGLLPLGTIPLSHQHNEAAFSEAFNALSTRIRFLNSGRLIRSLVVSSAMAGEGKSTVALHLAQASAQMGQRVLLVDANLRHPMLHTLLSLPNSQGLSTITEPNFNVYSALQQLPYLSNLSVLTAGQAIGNSTAVLGSRTMQSLMQQLQAEFDLVIYDSPPLVSYTDTCLLAPYTDGVVFVVKVSKTACSAATQAIEQLKTVHAQVLGFVANGVKQHTHNHLANNGYSNRNSGLKPQGLISN